MKIFEFAVVASDLDPYADDFEDRFFAAGCNDATIAFQNGVIILDFVRTATTFGQAVDSAVQNVMQAGARPVYVEAQLGTG